MLPAAWSLVFIRLLAAVAIGAGVGLIFGYPMIGVCVVLGAYLAWNLYHVVRLDRWLHLREGPKPREAPGIWGNVFAGMVRAQTRHKDRKRRLNRVLKEFRKATGAMPDAAVVLNAENEIVWLNDAATRFLGVTKADRGRRIDYLVRDPEFVEHLREGTFERAVPITSPMDGERKLSVSVISYGEEQRLLLAKDITRERRLQKVRRDFVGNASHELRSPLTVISGYLDNLDSDPDLPDGWREPVDEMVVQAARMRRIIDDLLTLSRLEASSGSADQIRVDVCGLAALIRKDALASRTRCAEIDLELESAAGLLGAESELYSAFWNLVQNAVKYTPPEGRITVRWVSDDAGGHFSVADTGVGIPEEAIPRVTERFYRVDKGRDRAKGGTGLGLAIVKHVLQRHDARLEVQSEIGVGSVFTCHFPSNRIAD